LGGLKSHNKYHIVGGITIA